MRAPALTSLAVLCAACAQLPVAARAEPALASGSLESGGRTRTFLYALPPPKDGVKPALVLGLHGRMGDGKNQEKMSHLASVGAQEGFAVALPDGYGKGWHDARGVGPGAEAKVDDAAFLSALVDWFVARGVDPDRVYALGMSNGGFMALTLACLMPEKLAGVASVTGTVSKNLEARCPEGPKVPVALVLGDQDPLVPWAGGTVRGNRGAVLSGRASAEFFAGRNGCAGPPEAQELPDVDPSDGTRVTLERWVGCAGGEVRLYTVRGGGHTWPGGWAYLGERLIGKTSRDLDATREAWRFFQLQRRAAR